MQKIFIPPLGSVITLGKPWNFTLYCERRNFDLGKRAGLLTPQTVRDYYAEHQLGTPAPHRSADRVCRWTSRWAAEDEARAVWKAHEAASEALKQKPDWKRYPRNVIAAQVTLPKGTDLKVDRIYIRKGCEGFDSVTFWANTPPGALVKVNPASKAGGAFTITLDSKRKTRFWAKLAEVNHILANHAQIPTEALEEV